MPILFNYDFYVRPEGGSIIYVHLYCANEVEIRMRIMYARKHTSHQIYNWGLRVRSGANGRTLLAQRQERHRERLERVCVGKICPREFGVRVRANIACAWGCLYLLWCNDMCGVWSWPKGGVSPHHSTQYTFIGNSTLSPDRPSCRLPRPETRNALVRTCGALTYCARPYVVYSLQCVENSRLYYSINTIYVCSCVRVCAEAAHN